MSQGMATSGHWCRITHSLMIQKGDVTQTATSCLSLTKAERFCRKFGNFCTNPTVC